MKEPKDTFRGSNKSTWWVCNCGKETFIPTCRVTSGPNPSCGKCNLLPEEYFENAKFGKLRMKNPKATYLGSPRIIEWVCDCGREMKCSIASVCRGITKTCGKCDILPASHFESTKYGKLTLITPQDLHRVSGKIVEWQCDCGKTIKTKVGYVLGGDTKSCGKCTVIPKDKFNTTKYGRLTIKNPILEDIHPGSNKKLTWNCSCGEQANASIHNVVKGLIVSCGKCFDKATSWYEKNERTLKQLKTPIHPCQIPPGNLMALETITRTCYSFKALCGLCQSEYHPMWDNIRTGGSLSCGCSANRTSGAQKEISSYINSMDIETILEYDLNGRKYDICVPDHNMLIEYHGLKWHRGEVSKRRDAKKYNNAIEHKFEFMVIFEDEWLHNREFVESILRNRFKKSQAKSLRPKECTIESVSLVNNHSITEVIYNVFFQEKELASILFKRSESNKWELNEMISNPEFRIHGIWSKLLKQFVHDYSPSSIVGYSNNRLFSGIVYEKMGFSLGQIEEPRSFWTNGSKRFNDYELTEKEKKHRVWDIGRKRWIFNCIV
jgi:hypothetical protein